MVYKIYQLFQKLNYIPFMDELSFIVELRAEAYRRKTIRKKNRFHPSVIIGAKAILTENIFIGEGTYFGSYCQFFAGLKSKIIIGKFCAIGHNVHIKSKTHHLAKYTPDEKGQCIEIEKDVVINDHVWIGDNVFIREGVEIGKGCIIGANSVVTKSLQANAVYAGIPARMIRKIVPEQIISFGSNND